MELYYETAPFRCLEDLEDAICIEDYDRIHKAINRAIELEMAALYAGVGLELAVSARDLMDTYYGCPYEES